MQVADRLHVLHNLCEAALSEVKAHSNCWAAVLDVPAYEGPRVQTTLERWHQVHALLDQDVGLLECARRLQLALNTVKRYARADRPERMLRVPKDPCHSRRPLPRAPKWPAPEILRGLTSESKQCWAVVRGSTGIVSKGG
ncbi:hypothetical protein GCM10009646_01130 [Streptomyces aureus]